MAATVSQLAVFAVADHDFFEEASGAGATGGDAVFGHGGVGADEVLLQIGDRGAEGLGGFDVAIGDFDAVFQVKGELVIFSLAEAGAGAVFFPFVGVEFGAGIEVGELFFDFGVEGFGGAVGGPAAVVLGPEAMEYEAELFAFAALVGVAGACGFAVVGGPGEGEDVEVEFAGDVLAGGGGFGLGSAPCFGDEGGEAEGGEQQCREDCFFQHGESR